MFCPECGSYEEAGSFCSNCGTRLECGEKFFGTVKSFRISTLRHPKESLYFTIGAIWGVIAWIGLIWLVILLWWVAIPLAISLYISKQFLKAALLGNSLKVSKDQYPEIFEIAENYSRVLNLKKIPDIYIINSSGVMNALAIRILKDKYVLLFSELVDALLAHNSLKVLGAVIGHELGHHAAGHLSWWRKFLLWPAHIFPFFIPAYSRACELTADRIGMYLCGDREASSLALITLACGSKVLSPKANIKAFLQQERSLPSIFPFFHDLYSNHPRITKRVLPLEEFSLRPIDR